MIYKSQEKPEESSSLKATYPWLTCDPVTWGGEYNIARDLLQMLSVPGCTPELLSSILTCRYLGGVLEKMEDMNNCLETALDGRRRSSRQVVTARVI